jgi:cobalamin biosynthesis protein CobT
MEGEVSADMLKVAPLFAWEAQAREWIGMWPLVAAAVEEKGLSPDYHDKLDALMPFLPRLVALRTSKKGGTSDLLRLAIDILNKVFDQDESKYMEGSPDEEPADVPGSAAAKAEDSEGKEKSDKGAGTAGDDGEDIITVDKLSEMLGDHVVSRTGMHLEHEVGEDEGWTIPAPADYVIKKKFTGTNFLDTTFVKSELENNVRPLAGKLRTKLQVRSKGRYEYGTKFGKLHAGSLHRLVSGRGTEAESRVFRQHVTSDTLDTAVSLLVDCSGSMSGTKYDTACAAAVSVAMALRPLHIPYNVLGFSTEYYGTCRPIINVFNDWNENVTQDEMLRRFGVVAGELQDNSDGDCVAWAANYLQQRKEKRKILIVLSDGAPAGRFWAGNPSAYTKEVVKTLEQRKVVEVYGIGILDRNVEKYYTKHMVINKVSELPSVLLSTLEKAI